MYNEQVYWPRKGEKFPQKLYNISRLRIRFSCQLVSFCCNVFAHFVKAEACLLSTTIVIALWAWRNNTRIQKKKSLSHCFLMTYILEYFLQHPHQIDDLWKFWDCIMILATDAESEEHLFHMFDYKIPNYYPPGWIIFWNQM